MSANNMNDTITRRSVMKWVLSRRRDSDLQLDPIKFDIDRFFDDFFPTGSVALQESEIVPRIDIEEDETAVHVRAEIPGIDEKDLNVTLNDRFLVISGEKREEKREEDKKKNYVFSERRFGSFCRRIAVPENIRVDEIKAEYKNGVLNVALPKDDKAMPKKIEINVH
jgi:HSP20 family protein